MAWGNVVWLYGETEPRELLPLTGHDHSHTLAPDSHTYTFDSATLEDRSFPVTAWGSPAVNAPRHACQFCGTRPLLSEYVNGKCPNCGGLMDD